MFAMLLWPAGWYATPYRSGPNFEPELHIPWGVNHLTRGHLYAHWAHMVGGLGGALCSWPGTLCWT